MSQINTQRQESTTVNTFADDALGMDDAVGIAARIRAKEVSVAEVTAAAIARAQKANRQLHAVVVDNYVAARKQYRAVSDGFFYGVPFFIKDNTAIKDMPSQMGSQAFTGSTAKHDDAITAQLMAQGFVCLGKSTLPEFGFNGSTEYMHNQPTRNPWHLAYSAGGSSGGSAALVAAGVVPLAHANDGGGSIRIPAACCGLVGLKPTRGRLAKAASSEWMPINIVTDGVLTRSVRDVAQVFYEAEKYLPAPKMPAIGLVAGASNRRLKVGMVLDSVVGLPTDADTKQAVLNTAKLLSSLGHDVIDINLPMQATFADDFQLYWAFLAQMIELVGKPALGKDFDARQLDNLSKGLAKFFRQHVHHMPQALYRLNKMKHPYAAVFQHVDVLLTPVVGHTTPLLGSLSPNQPFDTLIHKLRHYVCFTPLNNVVGSPAMSLPLGKTAQGLPIGVHFSAKMGDEKTLLELAFEIEAAAPWALMYH